MPFKDSIFNRVKQNLQWDDIKLLLFFNIALAILLALAFSFSNEIGVMLKRISRNIIFALCIGGSIYTGVIIVNIDPLVNDFKRILVLFILFLAFGWVGALIGWVLSSVILSNGIEFQTLKSLFFRISFLILIFGSLVYIYFHVRIKLKATYGKLAQKEIQEQKLQQLKTKAELKALRAKVNPHFLFNTLNSISSLIYIDQAKAEEMLQKISHLFRYAFGASEKEMINLSEELELVSEYLELETLRLGERLTYYIKSEAVIDDILLPPLLLQPLVENSVKYAIAPFQVGGSVSITAKKVEDYCEITIKDSGKNFNHEEWEEGFGLQGVKERLALHYKDESKFSISTENEVSIKIKIPLNN